MKRSEVYSWRLAPALKAVLEQKARHERASVGRLLERIALEWLGAHGDETDGDDEQRRRRERAARTFGRIAGGDSRRSTTVRAAVRRRLAVRRDH
ncbi:MAG: hypothetical protein ACREF4_03355 [Gammaproteobacteria bacterium]